MRLQPELLEPLDDWRAQQRPIQTRPEAIRELMQFALREKGHLPE